MVTGSAMEHAAAGGIARSDAENADRADPLAHARGRFTLPDGVIYLDGNSLGALPAATPGTMARVVNEEWGIDLIRAWNSADWVNRTTRVGDRLARLLGAQAGEVVIADSTSVNVFKLLAAAVLRPDIASAPNRRTILTESGNFPTDIYMAEGLGKCLGGRFDIRTIEGDAIIAALSSASASASSLAAVLLTHVDYRSGRMHDMQAINQLAGVAGVPVIWDLSHSAGAVPLDLNGSGCEFAVGCGYKYLNGGPGAPGYVYVAHHMQARCESPLSGWFGHREPFAFKDSYMPAPDIRRFQCGTPGILGLAALDCGIATFDDISMAALREKSIALSVAFEARMAPLCAAHGFVPASPGEPGRRGSQLSYAHDHAYEIMQALIRRNVIGDFRQPNLLRFGFTPLYTRFVDCHDAVATIDSVMRNGKWRDPAFAMRNAVT